jgi:hypothetical protein
MGGDDGTVYELWPEGRASAGTESYGARDEAEQAATAMLIRQPELLFVEIAERAPRDAEPLVVGRIAPAQPPAPAHAAIDDLHKLPRGAPEQ